ncbi:hypothetical protein D9758_018467 [Tetrapyrgos nigripes]|uniref:Ubiquitin-like protease family profile domain-containing protein n=1 Tax=Tetrapyrgos nigripes TaxID=182062 RepID=A0A8H5B7V1_9AGAR|nr:hypothetical protein D9758_018467 [Tetrapyrgos nigripes]
MPTLSKVNELHQRSIHALAEDYQTSFTGSPVPMKLPFWALTYWLWVYKIQKHHTAWKEALEWFKSNGYVGRKVKMLDPLPWQLEFPQALGCPLYLSQFLRDEWLNAENINQMLAVLNDELQLEFPVENIYWTNTLVAAYRCKNNNSYRPNHNLDIVRNQLRDGVQKHVMFPVFVHLQAFTETMLPTADIKGNHWGAVAVNVEENFFSYGDSSCGWVASELLEAVRWFLAQTFPNTNFKYKENGLPAGLQNDTDSCGLYCVNTISHHLAPEIYPLYTNESIAGLRRTAYEKVLKLILKKKSRPPPPPPTVHPILPKTTPPPHTQTTSIDLKEKADEILFSKAPSTVVEQLLDGKQEKEMRGPKPKKVKVDPNPIMDDWMEKARKLDREQQHAMIDKELTIHFAALPSTQIESPSFRRAFILADRTYKIPTRTRLDKILIPAQEVVILKNVLGRLGNEHNLMTSFDGGTKNDEAYFTTFQT